MMQVIIIFMNLKRGMTAYNLKRINYNGGIKHAKDILSGKYGFMCQYNKKMNFDTIWSSLFDIKNLNIYIAEGNPLRAKYKEDKRLLKDIKNGA